MSGARKLLWLRSCSLLVFFGFGFVFGRVSVYGGRKVVCRGGDWLNTAEE